MITYFCTKKNTKLGNLNPFAEPENPDLLKLKSLKLTGARLIGVIDSKLLKFIVEEGWLKLKPIFFVAKMNIDYYNLNFQWKFYKLILLLTLESPEDPKVYFESKLFC